MQTNPSNRPSLRVRNFVVSGTNYWNPGDDFVRDGVIHVLRALFPGEQLNFHFYNFNADHFPKSKFQGIGNEVSAGDLDLCRDFIDGVVVAGLSAGHEIKDLYRWIIANRLEDRVFLIGAGYENPYCAENMGQEPEATIFRKARIITGRTAKRPRFIDQSGTPYVHINCPALLSVKQVKAVPQGKKVERIGFSIQLPHEQGIPNQSTGAEVSRLAIDVLFALAKTHAVEVIAHHKSEYFYFLHLLKDTGIPVIYSSFYHDLHEVYPRYDLVVTTRLHSSLFANGHGIPGIIINDTDRHTHTLQGFPHSVWVNTRAAFDREFARAAKLDLSAVAAEMERFKTALTARYVETLKPVFAGQGVVAVQPGMAPAELVSCLRSELGAVSVKRRVLDVMSGLTADYWLENNKEDYRKSIAANAGWFDTPTFLNWFASELKPTYYLEIGVRRGRSMAQVLTRSPQTHAYGFDMWLADYGCLPEKGIITTNPGPAFVVDELRRLGVSATPKFIVGSSHETLRPFFADKENPQQFDLMLVDGDHSDDGARKDLEVAFAHVAPGGAIVFDDTRNSAHPGLQGVWDSFKAVRPDFLFIEDTHRTGTAIAFRPPFDRVAKATAARLAAAEPRETAATYQFDSEKKEQALVRSMVRPGMTVFDVGAHIGKYTKLFSFLVGEEGRVVSFEATPATGARLAERIAQESLANVTLNRVAVSDRDGTVTIHQFPEEYSSWNGIGRPSMEDPRDPSKIVAFVGASEVPSTTLDSYCRQHGITRIDYLKLDVEGAEIFALNGAENLFSRQAVGCIQFEISRKMLEGLGTRARQAFEFLARHGYECHVIGEQGEIGPVATDSDSFYENYVAFPVKVAGPATSKAPVLPVHFFTIVLNGQPFIRHHIEQFKTLPFHWHWHIVEGVAELNHDTGWSKEHGGRIPADQHRKGLSIDGTTEYLNELKRQFPDNITVHRPPAGRFWDGKREMVNAPLAGVPDDSLLWQVDADELWTASQIIRTRSLFLAHPEKTAAYFWCHYFVGPDRVITSRDTYGNHSDFEWLRVWRFRSGDKWMAHEPPRLGRCQNGLPPVDVSGLDPILHADTEAMGLVFQHFAYATEAQAGFKRDYYGYRHAVSGWKSLQEASLPCRLGDHFDWVNDQATVDRSSVLGLESLAPAEWFGGRKPADQPGLGRVDRILFVRTDSIGDNVLASSMLAPLKAAHPEAKIAVLCQAHVAELYLASPVVDSVICYERAAVETEAGQREIVDEIAAYRPDVILNSVRSRDVVSEILTLGFRETRHIAIESDLCNLSSDNKADADKLYSLRVPALTGAVSELEQHRAFLDGIGIESKRLVPAVWTSAADEAVAEEFFAVNGLDPLKTVALFPFTQHEIKDCPLLAESLVELEGWNFIILGGSESRDRCETFGRKLRGTVHNVAGMTTLREMAALIRRCRLVVGADSCAPHMACALGVPNVVVLGGGHFGRFMPYSALTAAVSLPMDCYGCNWQCRHACAHCVKDIPAALVARAVMVTLAGLAPMPRVFVPAEAVAGTAGQDRIRQMESLFGTMDVELCPVALEQETVGSLGPVDPDRLDALLSQLEKALAVQDMVTAEKILRQAHAEFPANSELATALANLQFQSGHFEDAIPSFQAACALKPNDPVLPVLLAHACMNAEDAAGVESALALAFRVQPGNPHALRFVADMNWKLGRHREAAVAYGQLVQGGNTETEVFLALGACFQKLGDTDGAVACCQEVLQRAPAHTEANRRLAALRPKEARPVAVPTSAPAFVSPTHEQVPCPRCGGRSARNVRSAADIVQCGACEMVYLRTRLTRDGMRKLYQSYADDGSHMALPKSLADAEKSGLTRDYFLKEILEFVEPHGGFLDVGCGWGGFLLNARKKGFTPRGIELTRKCVGYANEQLGIPVVDSQLEDTEIPAGSLSVVSMNHVLEHLPEPRKALQKVIDSLRPGGMYCGMVPNFGSACSEAEKDKWYWLDANFHYTHFTPATLRRTLEEAGFIVERIYTATGDYGRESVRKACLPLDPKLADNDYFAAEIQRYEAEGRGEEIRFFARKPATAVPADLDSANASEYLLIDPPGLAKDPLVSVVVSTYRAEQLIRACLTNLTRQTIFDRCEVIVVDSGSPENERAIVAEFQAKHPNIRYLRTARETLYGAWNRGLEIARGRFWVNANTDDSLRDDALEVLVAAMAKNSDCALAYGDTAWTSVPNDTFPSKNILQTVKYPAYAPVDTLFFCVTGCLQFWRTDSLRGLGGFDATLKYAGDYEATVKLMKAGLNAVHVPEALSLFFQNTQGLTQSGKGADEEHERVMLACRDGLAIDRVFKVDPCDPKSEADAWCALGLRARKFSNPWEKTQFEHFDFAVACFRRALALLPSHQAAGLNLARIFADARRFGPKEEQELSAAGPVAQQWIARIRSGEGWAWTDAQHAVQGRTYRPSEWNRRPTAQELAGEPTALRPWIARIDGRHVYLSEDLFPAPAGLRYTPQEHEQIVLRLASLLRDLPEFYAHFGGAGDALLLLASFYDQKPGAIVFSYPNSVGATKAFFDGFPKLGRIYFLPAHADGYFHIVLRYAIRVLKNCLGAGATPREGYEEEWKAGLDLAKRYGISPAPRWAAAFRKNQGSKRVALAPMGSMAGMVGSKRNIVDPAIWPEVVAHVQERGFEPVILGLPAEAKDYPALPGCADARGQSFAEQMATIGGCAGLVGADSWGKTFSALAGIPTLVFEPLKGPDLQGWKDPADWVFIEPWPAIRMVTSLETFRTAFDQRIAGLAAKSGAGKPVRPVVAWEGSFLDYGSLSHINRELSSHLADDGSVRLTCVSTQPMAPSAAQDPAMKKLARNVAVHAPEGVALTIRHQWPPNWSPVSEGKLVVIQPWEYGALPQEWVDQAGNVDEFWVPSRVVRSMYVTSGIAPQKVRVLPNGVDARKFRPGAAPLTLATRKKFKFLFVGGTIHRKGPDVLLNAYLNAFKASDDVCLVIKDFGGGSVYRGQTAADMIAAARKQPNAPEILHLAEELAADKMPSLYAACDCLVHPYRGEGFGMPVLEAMACGLPVVVTEGGSTADFVSIDAGWFIPARETRLGNKVGDIRLSGECVLLEPSVSHLVGLLREIAGRPDEARRRGTAGRGIVERRFDWADISALASFYVKDLLNRSTSSPTPRPVAAAVEPKAAQPAAKKFELPKAALVGHIAEARGLLQQKKHRAAWDSTCAAIAVRPFHPEGWLLLGQIAQDAGDVKLALQCADRVKALAPQWKPGRDLAKALQKRSGKATLGWPLPAVAAKPRLTVCLIAKNEERFLGQCLASVKDLADEIVVVDTGSTDKTVEIAKGFGAKIGHFEWCNDFGAARNAALELATGDWILVLDADEELDERHRDEIHREMARPDTMAWRLPLYNVGKEADGVSYVPRLFRNAPALFYVGRVHEQVFTSIEVRRAEWGLGNELGKTLIRHHGYTEELTRDRNKIERNRKLLEQAVEEHPGDPNLTFNLGLELVRSGLLDAGLARYREAADLLGEQSTQEIVPELREVILVQWLAILKDAGRFDEMVAVRRHPLLGKGTLPASLHYLLGFAEVRAGDPAVAIRDLQACLAQRGTAGLTPAHRDLQTCAPEHCLALAHVAAKQPAEAREAFALALARSPGMRPVIMDLARFEAGEGDYGRALTALYEVVQAAPQDVGAWRLGAAIALNRPEVLEVALDWTQSALQAHPDDTELQGRRAEALLLGGHPAEALGLLEKLGSGLSLPQTAAKLVCQLTVDGAVLPTSPLGTEVNQAFLQCYRRLVEWGAEGVVRRLNGRAAEIEKILPVAAQVLRAVLADVGV